MLQLHAAQIDSKKPMERVLLAGHKHLFSEKVKNAVDAEMVGLKGDIKHSDQMTDKVGEILGTARGYFDKVKEAKKALDNPVGAIGDAVGDAVGNIASSFGFRNLEGEDAKEEGKFFYFKIILIVVKLVMLYFICYFLWGFLIEGFICVNVFMIEILCPQSS